MLRRRLERYPLKRLWLLLKKKPRMYLGLALMMVFWDLDVWLCFKTKLLTEVSLWISTRDSLVFKEMLLILLLANRTLVPFLVLCSAWRELRKLIFSELTISSDTDRKLRLNQTPMSTKRLFGFQALPWALYATLLSLANKKPVYTLTRPISVLGLLILLTLTSVWKDKESPLRKANPSLSVTHKLCTTLPVIMLDTEMISEENVKLWLTLSTQ